MLVTYTLNALIVAMHQSRNHLSTLAGIDTSEDEEGDECLVWTHSQLRHAALQVTAGLLAAGVESGDTITTFIPNGVEWALLQYANSICRLTLACLDYGATSAARKPELQNFIKTLQPAIVVVSNKHDATTVDAALQYCNVVAKVKIILDDKTGAPSLNGWTTLPDMSDLSLDKVQRDSDLLEQARQSDPDRISFICFTSGTSSGSPKGCPRHVAGTTALLDSQASLLRFDTGTRYLHVSANFRVVAPALTTAAWKAGGAIVMPGTTFSAKATLDAFEKHGITNLTLVPALLHALTNDQAFSSEKVRSLKCATFGGDMITKEVLLKAKAAFPHAKIAASHGMTEGGGFFEWPYFDTDVHEIPYYGGISPLGTVAPGAKLRIYNVESNRIAERNELGEFQACAPSTIKHYLNDTNQDAFYEDKSGRWFKTADIGLINEDGIVYLVSRMNDRIKRCGVPITPAALESCIEEFTGFQVRSTDILDVPPSQKLTPHQTSVFGVAHPEFGHEPYAVVEQLGGSSEDQIKQHVIDLFGKDYSLGGVFTLQHLNLTAFPRNATDKIMK